MAPAALRVAGRRLSQHSRAGAPVLLRQVTAGGAGERDNRAGEAARAELPGPLKRKRSRSPGSELVPGSFTEDGAGDPGLRVLESGYSSVLVE